jgi:disulfide bond formation protein DsbB
MRCALLNHPLCRALFSTRGLFFLMAAASLFLMLFALYLQHFLGEHPCPLCITQRMFVIVIGVLALLAAVHNPAQLGRRVWSALVMLAAIGGGIVAGSPCMDTALTGRSCAGLRP